ncbi:hypothetical protein QQ045_019054 [Rhodiola kirilowii]
MVTSRPRKLAQAVQPLGSDIDPARLPALGYKWNVPKSFMHTSHHVLMLYRDLLDRQEANDVVWTPYTDAILAPLNPICLDGRESWRTEVPLICFHIAEWHYPSRVLRQFEWGQPEPGLPPASHKEMHTHIRRTAHLVDDVMQGYIHLWDNRAANIVTGEADTDGSYLEPYYSWYSTVTRKRIQPPLHTPEPYCPSRHEHYLLVNILTAHMPAPIKAQSKQVVCFVFRASAAVHSWGGFGVVLKRHPRAAIKVRRGRMLGEDFWTR